MEKTDEVHQAIICPTFNRLEKTREKISDEWIKEERMKFGKDKDSEKVYRDIL